MVKSADYISFNKEHLFTVLEFLTFLDTDPVNRARLLADVIVEYLLIQDNVIFLYDAKTVSYSVVCTPSVQDYLLMMTRKFIVESYKNLSVTDKLMITKMYHDEIGRDCMKLFNLNFVRDFVLDMYYMLSFDDVTFNRIPKQEVHYINGYYNVKTQKFQSRNSSIHYITKDELIATPYEEPDEEEEEEDEDEEYDNEDEEVEEKKPTERQFSKKEIKRVIDLL